MTRFNSPRGGGVRYHIAVKSLSFVFDDDRNFLLGFAAAADVNMLARVFMISVNDGILQCLAQRDFNVSLVARSTSAVLDQEHELVNKGRDCTDFAWQSQLQLEARTAVTQITLPLSLHRWIQKQHPCQNPCGAK